MKSTIKLAPRISIEAFETKLASATGPPSAHDPSDGIVKYKRSSSVC